MTAFLAVTSPAADPIIGHLRERWDPSSRRGLGAHITIRYPFLSLQALSPRDIETLAEAVAAVQAFDYTLARVARFPTTIFLDPEPVAPFARLRAAVESRFHARLPVDNFPTFVPHLSVARNVEGHKTDVLVAIDQALGAGPVVCACRELALLEREGGPWTIRARFPLG